MREFSKYVLVFALVGALEVAVVFGLAYAVSGLPPL